ncbi:replication initiation and membrane attachment family protein [Lentibacillus cibarius]|uniref:Chromosome replication initiation protein n=1 Tax=Lentibacillus cibarius TaxID=2583219 RepID=A0A5S3QKZ3_9BACI|nr:DnaD domain protein [Lentibacillus cibarius]TMN21136.1 chromosome replication initiation protein [Lentibacillus cibarius]
MRDIGKILPIDGYHVLMEKSQPADYLKSLTHLYQPLIGIQAVTLYMTLLHEKELQQQSTVQTHHTLMNYMNLPLDDLYRARLKLEGIGLMKTFKEQSDEYSIYTYELRPPFAPAQFFTDEMLAQLLYHHIGQAKFDMLKNHYVKQEQDNKGANITASFNDVFQTIFPDGRYMEAAGDLQDESTGDIMEPDFSWMEQVLKQRMIPTGQVLTNKNRQLIAQMMTLYDLPEYEVEKAVLWALTEENTLNRGEFKEACHDLFRNNHQGTVRLTDKQVETTEEAVQNPTTKEEQLIAELERISPKQLLEDLSNGGQASGQDLKVIREVMTTQGLPSPVMNVLIHYVLLQTNMKLSKAYMETIASHWSRANLKTAREAIAFAKNEKMQYQQRKNRKKSTKKTASKEVVPDWFHNRKKKKQENDDKPQHSNTDKEWQETEQLLKKYSKKKNG